MDVVLAVDELVGRYLIQCLWFLRRDYYPTTDDDRLRVLGYLEKYGDLEAFRLAAAIKPCLSPPSNATSAG